MAKRMADSGTDCRRSEAVESVMELMAFVREMASKGNAVHEVEQGIWGRVLSLGHHALQVFFDYLGDGDVGEVVELPDGHGWRRFEELHRREYQSIFGLFELHRAVYGLREGQRIEYVPLDTPLGNSISITRFLCFAYTASEFQRHRGLGLQHGRRCL